MWVTLGCAVVGPWSCCHSLFLFESTLLSGEHRGGNWPVYCEQLFRLERLLRGGMCRHQYLGAVGGETTKGGDYVE